MTDIVDTNIIKLRDEKYIPEPKNYSALNMGDFTAVYSTFTANTLKLMYNEYIGSKAIKHTSVCVLDQKIADQTWSYEHNLAYDYIRTSLRHTSDLVVKKLQPMQMTPLGWHALDDIKVIGLCYLREDDTTWIKHKFWHTFVLLHGQLSYIAHSLTRNSTTSVFNFEICSYTQIFDERILFAKDKL